MPERIQPGTVDKQTRVLKPAPEKRPPFVTAFVRPTPTRAPSAEFVADSPEGLCPSTHLAAIINTAIRVGRGTKPMNYLAAMLEPYGVRRKR